MTNNNEKPRGVKLLGCFFVQKNIFGYIYCAFLWEYARLFLEDVQNFLCYGSKVT